MPDAPRFAHHVRPGLLEVPVTTVRFGNRNFPAGGGGYFRLMPYALSRNLLQRVNRVDGKPAVFYFHPWEIDAEQPRVAGIDAKTRFRHYLNLDRMEARLRRLLFDFTWRRMDEVFVAERGQAPAVEYPEADESPRMNLPLQEELSERCASPADAVMMAGEVRDRATAMPENTLARASGSL
jgi:hypothetical protein